MAGKFDYTGYVAATGSTLNPKKDQPVINWSQPVQTTNEEESGGGRSSGRSWNQAANSTNAMSSPWSATINSMQPWSGWDANKLQNAKAEYAANQGLFSSAFPTNASDFNLQGNINRSVSSSPLANPFTGAMPNPKQPLMGNAGVVSGYNPNQFTQNSILSADNFIYGTPTTPQEQALLDQMQGANDTSNPLPPDTNIITEPDQYGNAWAAGKYMNPMDSATWPVYTQPDMVERVKPVKWGMADNINALGGYIPDVVTTLPDTQDAQAATQNTLDKAAYDRYAALQEMKRRTFNMVVQPKKPVAPTYPVKPRTPWGYGGGGGGWGGYGSKPQQTRWQDSLGLVNWKI